MAYENESVQQAIDSLTVLQLREVFKSKKIPSSRMRRSDMVEILLAEDTLTVEKLLSLLPPGSTPKKVKQQKNRSLSRGRKSAPGRRQSSPHSSQSPPSKTSSKNSQSPMKRRSQKAESPSSEKRTSSKSDHGTSNGHCMSNGPATDGSGDSPMRSSSPSIVSCKDDFAVENLVLWKHPFSTIYYFSIEAAVKCHQAVYQLRHHWALALFIFALAAIFALLDRFDGHHSALIALVKSQVFWCSYWVFLGVLSSVGLGTGLHTFLLYLGPHIASVTLAAFECNSVDFPSPPYPESIVCPEESELEGTEAAAHITIWQIMSKVRVESFMWGLGTALGELPPYFMARAARLSGTSDLDAEMAEWKVIREQALHTPEKLPLSTRAKIWVEGFVERVGFLGILLMASIPNPLFDLAGLTCGYLLVPFWQFFGATAIGKAIIKMHIQLIGRIPKLGPKLQAPFQEYFVSQKNKLHVKGSKTNTQASWLSWVFDKLVICMVLYFVVSIVNSLAQAAYARRNPKKVEEATDKKSK